MTSVMRVYNHLNTFSKPFIINITMRIQCSSCSSKKDMRMEYISEHNETYIYISFSNNNYWEYVIQF